ncbi:hypothetical protein D3C72_1467470 [compost metagenome]
MLGIHQGDDGVDEVGFGDLLVHEEGLRHRAGVGQAGGLDHHAVEVEQALALLGGQQLQRFAQVFADGAADAAVAHLHDLLLRLGHEDVAVDVLLAELVLDDRDLLAMGLGQDALEQRGFARAEKAGQDGRGNEGHGKVLRKRKTEKGGGLAGSLANATELRCRRGQALAHRGFLTTTSPFRYSPSGNSMVIGWSGAAPRRSAM